MDSSDCPVCVSHPEDIDHIFTRCSTAREVGAVMQQWVKDWPSTAASISDIWRAISNFSGRDLERKVGEVIGLTFFWIM